jgi:hypothetical protein
VNGNMDCRLVVRSAPSCAIVKIRGHDNRPA